MRFLNLFKRKGTEKCAVCLRSIYTMPFEYGGKKYCSECYNKMFANGVLTTENTPSDTPSKNTFVCDICKKDLPIKYRHKDNICVDCIDKAYEATKMDKAEKKIPYTYRVGLIAPKEPWIFIQCNEDDAREEPKVFSALMLKATIAINNGVWQGTIVPVSESRFTIKNDPLSLVYQYDSLFGIVIEYRPETPINEVLYYLKTVLDIQVDDEFFDANS